MLKSVAATPIYGTIKEGSATQVLFSVEVDKLERTRDISRTRLLIAVDRSGSMNDTTSNATTKMDRAKESLAWVIDNLSPEDEICVVAFDDVIDVIIPLQSLQNNAEVLKAQVAGLSPRGMTNIGDAVMECYRQLKDVENKDVMTKIIILSDGEANEGVKTPDDIRGLISNARNRTEIPTTVSSFGLGLSYNELFMGMIAESGGGGRYHIENADHIPEMMSRDLSIAKDTVGREARLEIRTSNSTLMIEDGRNISGEGEWCDGLLTIEIGDLVAGETKEFLVEFDIASRGDGGNIFDNTEEFGEMAGVELFEPNIFGAPQESTLCEYRISWLPMDDVDRQSTPQELVPIRLGTQEEMESSINEEARSTALVLMLSSAFCKATDLVDRGDPNAAADLLRPILGEIGEDPSDDYWDDYPDIFQIIYDAAKDLLDRKDSGQIGSNMAQTYAYTAGIVGTRSAADLYGSHGGGNYDLRSVRAMAYNAGHGGTQSRAFMVASRNVPDDHDIIWGSTDDLQDPLLQTWTSSTSEEEEEEECNM